VTLHIVSLPDKSVICINVSLNVARMWATAKQFSPSLKIYIYIFGLRKNPNPQGP
jgi:hypothetical protein